MASKVAAIVIGRNEGERLVRCLASLEGQAKPIIYVDSGSADGSVMTARNAGTEVVELDILQPFTAARARNAGIARLLEIAPEAEFVQFVDGDCELRESWIDTAMKAIKRDNDTAVVCGRRRERFPDASIYNRLIDAEWETTVGEAKACGGDALMRRSALDQVGGYRDDLIAGEEPEMCYRMRRKGWRILRVDAEMTWHDAAITRFSQWWQRSRRAGRAFAEVAALHRREPERFWVAETRRALFWGVGIPLAAVLGALLFTPWLIGLLLALPLQIARLWLRGWPMMSAIYVTLGKFPEGQGVMEYLIGRRKKLIEYK